MHLHAHMLPIALSALGFYLLSGANGLLFHWADYDQGVSWVFLPSGLRLALVLRRRHPSPESPPGLGVALAGKLLALPLAMLLLASLLGLPPLLRDAVVLQAAAPTGVSVLLLTEAAAVGQPAGASAKQQGAAEAVAALVLWSTGLALVSVPLWWWLLSGPLGS